MAVLIIFQTLTLAGWDEVMFYCIEVQGFFATVYFCTLLVLGSYFRWVACGCSACEIRCGGVGDAKDRLLLMKLALLVLFVTLNRNRAERESQKHRAPCAVHTHPYPQQYIGCGFISRQLGDDQGGQGTIRLGKT